MDLLIDAKSNAALVMVLSLLLAGVAWNFGTWYMGLPVSSSHTLIGSTPTPRSHKMLLPQELRQRFYSNPGPRSAPAQG